MPNPIRTGRCLAALLHGTALAAIVVEILSMAALIVFWPLSPFAERFERYATVALVVLAVAGATMLVAFWGEGRIARVPRYKIRHGWR